MPANPQVRNFSKIARPQHPRREQPFGNCKAVGTTPGPMRSTCSWIRIIRPRPRHQARVSLRGGRNEDGRAGTGLASRPYAEAPAAGLIRRAETSFRSKFQPLRPAFILDGRLMNTEKGSRFFRYLPLVLDALRSTHPEQMRPSQVRAWILAAAKVDPEDQARFIKNGQQTIFENDVHWARFFLHKGGLVASPKRGYWGLTEPGLKTYLNAETARELFRNVRLTIATGPDKDDENSAPGSDQDPTDAEAFWFVGAAWDVGDQLPRFISDGLWENGYEDRYQALVRRMSPGDRLVVKSAFVQRHGLPFDVKGKPVSVMRIKATGTIVSNPNDGRSVAVAWDPPFAARDWYFYTYRATIIEADLEIEEAQRLIDFVFRRRPQDYGWFLGRSYWLQKYGITADTLISTSETSIDLEALDQSESVEEESVSNYTVNDIVAEGCFLTVAELEAILDRWRAKKNLLLQGPPGTGKTWLAKRLGFAILGSKDRSITNSRLRIVQFHASLVYEDFVRGWRPSGGKDGLALADGVFMQAIDAARSEPDRPFVLVIEEINRGNPAQIFGEMLTLLEDTKRRSSEAIELTYRKEPSERVYVPDNLYVVGTMNVADRSLAIVDFALRRRFAFVDLEPRFGPEWRAWCLSKGLEVALVDSIQAKMIALNEDISASASLGPQFRIGHSFVTPEEPVADGVEWFNARVRTEIAPLLDEYWYDSPQHAADARTRLLAS